MIELLNAAVHPVNIIYTILLGISIVYWFSVILGIFDAATFDIDIDIDVDVDVDVDMDADADVGGGVLANALHFFNFGQMPFMVIMSFLNLFQWMLALPANHYLGHYTTLFALGAILPILAVSLILTKVFTTPLIPLFAQLDTHEEPVEYIGQTGIVTLSPTHEKAGQAEVTYEGNTLIITIRVPEDKALPKRGDEILVIAEAADKTHYLVQKFLPELSEF